MNRRLWASLLAVLVSANLFATVLSAPANAAPWDNVTPSMAAKPTLTECKTVFASGASYSVGSLSPNAQQMYTACEELYGPAGTKDCTFSFGTGGNKVTCKSATDSVAVKEQLVKPLAVLICGKNGRDISVPPDSAEELRAYNLCGGELDKIYQACGISITNAPTYVNSPNSIASCVKQKLNTVPHATNKSPTVAEIEQALKDGANVALNKQNEIVSQEAQDACVNKGDTWDAATNTCIPKAEQGAATCKIDGIGWIVCPVMTFLAKINDLAFNYISKNFLEVKIEAFNTTQASAYPAWQAFRNIANIAFGIVFLIIIYSQLTGAGLSNYGIKRMIPRLFIAAILVNASYFVCQIAIDLSNLLGYGLKSFFDATGNSLPETTTINGGWETVIAGLLAGGLAVAAFALAISFPMVVAALFALLMTAFILLARQALIILLVVISPLAFVAYLLPNTEQLYKKWQKMFMTLLMVFPVVSVIFGASTLASNVVKTAYPGDNVGAVLALGILAVPLFAVPTVLKGSLLAAGAIGAKLQGFATSANGNVGKRLGDSSRLGAYNQARKRNAQIKRAQITGGVYKGRNPFSRASSAFSSKLNNSRLTGQIGTRTAQQAAQLANKLEIENVEASNAQIKQANLNAAELLKVANGGESKSVNGKDASMRAAAIAELATTGHYKEFNQAWDNMVTGGTNDEKKLAADAIGRSSGKPAYVGQGALASLRQGGGTDANALIDSAIDQNVYSAEQIVKTDRFELAEVSQRAADPTSGSSQAGKQRLINNAAQAQTDPQLQRQITKNADAIDAIRRNSAYTVP